MRFCTSVSYFENMNPFAEKATDQITDQITDQNY